MRSSLWILLSVWLKMNVLMKNTYVLLGNENVKQNYQLTKIGIEYYKWFKY